VRCELADLRVVNRVANSVVGVADVGGVVPVTPHFRAEKFFAVVCTPRFLLRCRLLLTWRALEPVTKALQRCGTM